MDGMTINDQIALAGEEYGSKNYFNIAFRCRKFEDETYETTWRLVVPKPYSLTANHPRMAAENFATANVWSGMARPQSCCCFECLSVSYDIQGCSNLQPIVGQNNTKFIATRGENI